MILKVDEWARLWGCPEEQAETILNYLDHHKIADVTFGPNDVTLKNRRMLREEKAKNKAKMRKRKQREKEGVTPGSRGRGQRPETRGQIPEKESKKEELSGAFVLEVQLKRGQGTYKITQAEVDEWQAAFPNIKVMHELESLRLWNKDNEGKRKTRTGFRRHVTGWLKRASTDAKTKADSSQGDTGGFWGKKL